MADESDDDDGPVGPVCDEHGRVGWCNIPIMRAAYYGRVEEVRTRLANGESGNQRCRAGWNSLHAAVRNFGSVREKFLIMTMLLESGVDVDAIDDSGRTVTSEVVRIASLPCYGKLETCELLLRWKPSLSREYDHRNNVPLMYYVLFGGFVDMVRLFIEYGADIHVRIAKPYGGRLRLSDAEMRMCNCTLLHVCAALNLTDVAILLMSEGIDYRLQLADGSTALDVAVECNHTQVAAALVEAIETRKVRMLTVMMGRHNRLGEFSRLGILDEYLVRTMILGRP
jgi:hypothetical protein